MQSSENHSVRTRWLAYLLIGVASVVASFFKIPDGDIWMHLAQGRYILEHGVIPAVDVFSFTYGGRPWVNWEWLHNLLVAWVWYLGGWGGIILFRILIVAATVILLFHLAERLCRNVWCSTFLSSIGLLLIQTRVNDRPHLLSYLFCAWLLVVVFPWRPLSRERLLILFLIMLLWRNVHPSWPLGFPIIASCYLDSVVKREGPFSWRDCLLLGVLALIVWLITPQWEGLRIHFSLFEEGDAVLPEWRSVLMMQGALLSLEYLLFFLFTILFFFAVLHTERRKFPLYSLLVAMVVGIAFLHVRFVPDAAILEIPILASWLAALVPRPLVRERVLHMGMIAIVSLALVGIQSFFERLDRERGIGIDERKNPLFVGNFMKEHHLGGNIYGSFPGTNDFLVFYLFPTVKVPVDIRVPGLYPYEYAKKLWVVRSDDELQQNVLSLPLDYVIIGCPDTLAPLREHERGIEESLRRRGWSLIYFDKRYALYRRPRKEDGMRYFKILSRWNSSPEEVAMVVKNGGFEMVIDDLRVLKELTKGRDNFYREVFAMIYQIRSLTEGQRHTIEEIFNG